MTLPAESRERLWAEFDGSNVNDLVERYGLSHREVYQVLRQESRVAGSSGNQGGLEMTPRVTFAEIAQALNVHHSNITRRAKRESWPSASEKRPGRGGGIWFDPALLPKDVQDALHVSEQRQAARARQDESGQRPAPAPQDCVGDRFRLNLTVQLEGLAGAAAPEVTVIIDGASRAIVVCRVGDGQ